MNIQEIEFELNKLRKEFDSLPAQFGKRLTNAVVSTNFISGSSGWKISDNGDIEANDVTLRGTLQSGATASTHIIVDGDNGEIEFYGPDGLLKATIEGTNVATDGVDGILIHTTDGAGFDYLLSSAGFAFPGGTFDGSIGLTTGAGIALGGGFITPNVFLNDIAFGGSEFQLSLEMAAVIAAVAVASTHKVPIKINGTQYYLLATNV